MHVSRNIGLCGCVWEGAGRSMKPIIPDEVGRSIQPPAASSVYPGLSIALFICVQTFPFYSLLSLWNMTSIPWGHRRTEFFQICRCLSFPASTTIANDVIKNELFWCSNLVSMFLTHWCASVVLICPDSYLSCMLSDLWCFQMNTDHIRRHTQEYLPWSAELSCWLICTVNIVCKSVGKSIFRKVKY